MNLLELSQIVKLILDDDSLDGYITDYLNQAQLEIAGGMQSALGSWITPPLPELLTIGTVTTDITLPYVAMPTSFHRNLEFAVDSSGTEISIAKSFIEFTETYPALDSTGSITEVTEQGNIFYYQSIPTVAEDVTIHYYKKPTDMAVDADEPDGIPIHLQKSLLINHACWKLFELIEDGLEGPGPNTQRYMGLFFQALQTLELSIPYQMQLVTYRDI